MSRKMLINVMHPEEARVAIVQDGRLMELNIEISGKEQTKGNICKGVVLRVEPGLQAAFVDIGYAKPGFIQMGDLHPDAWQWRDDLPEDERKRRPRIQDVLRRGQELLVQVEKDARDTKGAALTGYLSLPGRYMVLMPGDSASGISRKIEDNSVRKELKALVAELQVPEGYGYIIRTEAVGRSLDELKKDLEYLVGVHQRITKQAAQTKGAAEIYRDAGVILRTIRDYFSDDIDEVLVDDEDACRQAIDFFKEIMPGCEKRVKLHREKRPIFSKYQLEEQIDQLYEKRVSLPSGGSLVIEPTEALVSIDVNSGKSSGERGVEDTAFKTNLEAAAEVARQLRLRDLGGLVVIDFIDMRDTKHNKEVERTLKDALKLDKARVSIGRISQFGMLEMSRQRIAKNINDAIHLECPHCEGRGRVKSVEAMALAFLRKVHAAAAKGQVAEVRGGLPLEVAYFLLNRKKRELAQIENDYGIVVTVKGKPSFLLNQLELEVFKKEKTAEQPDDGEKLVSDQPEPPSGDLPPAQAEAPADAAAKKKRKRRRKKKGGGQAAAPEGVGEQAVSPESVTEAPVAVEEVGQSVVAEELAEQTSVAKKRSSRSRSGAKKRQAAQGVAGAEVVDEQSHEQAEQDALAQPPEKPAAKRAKRTTAAKGRAKAATGDHEAEVVSTAADLLQATPAEQSSPEAEPATAKKPSARKPRVARAAKAAAEIKVELPPVQEAASAPKKTQKRASGRRKAAPKQGAAGGEE